jgi:uncharacterized protein
MELASIKYVALSLTHNCNLRCIYCYAGDKKSSRMDEKTGKKTLDFLANQTEKVVTITFFGGEPLLEYEMIKVLVNYADENWKDRFAFRISTNGTKLTREMLEFFAKHKIFFTLSLDGNKDQHDRSRPDAAGNGSYDKIVSKLDDILKFNPYTLAVSVIHPDTVGSVASGAKEIFKLGFRYLLQSLDYSADWKDSHIAVLKKQYLELSEYYYKKIMDDKKIYYSPFDERIKTWAQKPYELGDLCDIGNTQIAIAPSGNIYPCVQFIGEDSEKSQLNSMGNVFDGFNDKRRTYFVEQNYSERKECVGCALLGRCSNYCGCVNWKSTGEINKVPPIICEHERMLMPIADKLGNRLWKKNSQLFKKKFYDPLFPISSYIEDCMIKSKK